MEQSECPICEGRGGEVEHDMQGDGIWATPVSYFIPCTCLQEGRCPGCGAQTVPSSAVDKIDDFACPACEWMIDWDRINHPHEPDYLDY